MLVWLSAAALGATLDVCGTCAYTTVGDAVADASAGDTIHVAAGTYDETDLVIDFELTVIGDGSGVTTLRSASPQVLYLGSTTSIPPWPAVDVSGFTLEPTVGRGLHAVGISATLSDLQVADLSGTEPGLGAYVDSADVTFFDCTFENLATTAVGGAMYFAPATSSVLVDESGKYYYPGVTLENCTFEGNSAEYGGAIYAADAGYREALLSSSGTTFSGNQATSGGAVYHYGWEFSDFESSYDTFYGNTATNEGGAIWGSGGGTGSTFSYNKAAYGGAMAYGSGLTSGILEYNEATVAGGDIYSDGSGYLRDTTVTGSKAPSGGSIETTSDPWSAHNITLIGVTASNVSGGYTFGSVGFLGVLTIEDSSFDQITGGVVSTWENDPSTVTDSTFTHISGTAISIWDGALEVDRSSFSDNGGAIAVHGGIGSLKLTDSTFSRHASTAVDVGYTNLTVSDCVFEDNVTSSAYGGAIQVDSRSGAIRASSFAGNSAINGGAIAAVFGASIELDGNTFSGNSATESGGAVYAHGSAELTGNLLTDNSAAAGGAIRIELQWSSADVTISRNTFVGNDATTGGAIHGTGTDTTRFLDAVILRNDFQSNTAEAGGAIELSGTQGRSEIESNTFVENTALTGGALHFEGESGDITVSSNRFCRNSAEDGGAGATDTSTATAYWGQNVFVDNQATSTGGDLSLQTASWIGNNTFIGGDALYGGAVWTDALLEFDNNIVAWSQEYAVYGGGATATITYNDFWEVAPDALGGTLPPADATNLAVDPMWVSYVEGGCEALDLSLSSGSPLVDAGDPSVDDSDGTRSDIGVIGGDAEPLPFAWYFRDADGDGYAGSAETIYTRNPPPDHYATADDCDDADPAIHPGATELCDGIDNDCHDGVDDVIPTWRPDADADGWQSLSESARACDGPDGWFAEVEGPYDCDDDDPAVHPEAEEVPDDGVDQDCTGGDAETPEDTDVPDRDTDSDSGTADGSGCKGCTSGGPPTWAALLAGAFVIRRRSLGIATRLRDPDPAIGRARGIDVQAPGCAEACPTCTSIRRRR